MLAAPAMAQSISNPAVTGSIGYTQLDGDDATLGAITGRLNAKVNRYVGFEGEASFGVKDDEITVAGVTGDLSHDYGAGANYFFDGRNGVRADWTRRDFTDDNGGELDTYGLSYVRRF